MGVIGGGLRNRHKSVDMNSVPSTIRKETGAFKLNSGENVEVESSAIIKPKKFAPIREEDETHTQQTEMIQETNQFQ